MSKEIKKILIVINLKKNKARKVLKEMQEYFRKSNTELNIYSFEENFDRTVLNNTELAISVGGDGTLLYCAYLVASGNIPVLGVNLGTFGFITEISRNEWISVFEKYKSGRIDISERMIINADVLRNGKIVQSIQGMNDVVIGTNGVSRLIELKLFLSESYVGRYRADGVIIASPTGSTAYSMGAGGPIMHPEMEAFILNPICPFTLSNRPLIVPGNESVELEVEKVHRAEYIINVDGRSHFPLLSGDRVICTKYKHKSHIIRSDKRNFYEILRKKLNWSGEPNNA